MGSICVIFVGLERHVAHVESFLCILEACMSWSYGCVFSALAVSRAGGRGGVCELNC